MGVSLEILYSASAWNYVSVLQLLIERGCQFAARNNENFTASDYAFSLVSLPPFTS